jgi:hypothetical protein
MAWYSGVLVSFPAGFFAAGTQFAASVGFGKKPFNPAFCVSQDN